MPHYRAVMGTTLDCEGCQFDGDKCLSDEGCVAFTNTANKRADMSIEKIEEFLKQHEGNNGNEEKRSY